MARSAITLLFASILSFCLGPGFHGAAAARAEGISEDLLPATTKAYLCIPDYQRAKEKWDATQLGQLLNDPLMKPFVEDLAEQLRGRRGENPIELGVTSDELEAVAQGEVSWATVQPGGEAGQHAQVVIAQVIGNEQAAKRLLSKIGRNLVAQGALPSAVRVGGIDIVCYRLPRKRGRLISEMACHLVHQELLVTTDHEGLIRELAQRLQTPPTEKRLADLPAYQAAMERTSAALGNLQPQARWFVEPFGLMEVGRAVRNEEKQRGTDVLQVLRNQGFDAIQGFGGQVALKTDDHEMLHRTFVHAPARQTDARFARAARMLDFPNTDRPEPQPWVPAGVASYLTWNWKMQDAFEHSKSLVNELAGAKSGEDLFEDIIGSIRDDVAGPRVDLRKELVAFLAERATVFTDFREPITPQSERLMFSMKLTDPDRVTETIRKIMESDPDAQPRQVAGHVVWEIVSEEPAEVEEIRIVGAGFGPFDEPEEFEDEEEPILPNMAVTVANGNLMIASHIDFLTDVLKQTSGEKSLAMSPDYQRIEEALEKLGASQASFLFFARSDKAYRPTYELIRQGKMPESESVFGKLLNRMMGPDEAGVLREQAIDGGKMPPFEKVRQYLGPAGLFVTSQDDGWLITGCLQAAP